jgi:hypothetical protein
VAVCLIGAAGGMRNEWHLQELPKAPRQPSAEPWVQVP